MVKKTFIYIFIYTLFQDEYGKQYTDSIKVVVDNEI